jgi:hypothetical protein
MSGFERLISSRASDCSTRRDWQVQTGQPSSRCHRQVLLKAANPIGIDA